MFHHVRLLVSIGYHRLIEVEAVPLRTFLHGMSRWIDTTLLLYYHRITIVLPHKFPYNYHTITIQLPYIYIHIYIYIYYHITLKLPYIYIPIYSHIILGGMNFHLPTINWGSKAGDWKKLAARLGAVWSKVGLDDVYQYNSIVGLTISILGMIIIGHNQYNSEKF